MITMSKYKLITGFYPSKETSEKIVTKLKGKGKKAKVVPYEDGYTVVIHESDDYDEIDNVFSECMKEKIYCGILTERGSKGII